MPDFAPASGDQLREKRWHRQTKRGGGHVPENERGDCVPACITSILGLSLDAIPNAHDEGWWERLQAGCAKYGYGLALLNIGYEPPPSYWIASVPSLALPPDPDGKPAWHCVVARGYEFVFDPALGDRYDANLWGETWNADKVVEGWVLVPLDAALAVVRAHESSAGEAGTERGGDPCSAQGQRSNFMERQYPRCGSRCLRHRLPALYRAPDESYRSFEVNLG